MGLKLTNICICLHIGPQNKYKEMVHDRNSNKIKNILQVLNFFTLKFLKTNIIECLRYIENKESWETIKINIINGIKKQEKITVVQDGRHFFCWLPSFSKCKILLSSCCRYCKHYQLLFNLYALHLLVPVLYPKKLCFSNV